MASLSRRWASTAASKFDLSKFRKQVAAGPSLDSFMESAPPTPSAPIARKPIREEPLPSWLKLKLPMGHSANTNYNRIRASMRKSGLATVCEEAKCPNRGECWGGGETEAATATIMLMGDTCTRGCRFCSVKTSKAPPPLDPEEPENTAKAVANMGVDYIVITMVDRDDIADGGAAHVAQCIQAIKKKTEGKMLIECLTGDFRGNEACIETVASSGLEVFAHNVECVERATRMVRDHRAGYRQSLKVLETAKTKADVLTKSSIMLGFGETDDDIRKTLVDLRTAGVDCVTLGQYLQPTRNRMKVARYVHPDEFENWRVEGEKMGFLYVASGPMVRSSYRAGEYYITNILKKRGKVQA